MKTQQIVLAARPKAMPTLENFIFETIELPKLQENEVLLQGKYYSVDPYMRGRMNNAKSYVAPFQKGQPIEGGVVAIVVESKSDNLKPGDTVLGNLPWCIQTIVSANVVRKIDATDVPASYYLGILGMPGLTAYFGMMDICKPKTGETVIVSGAAGAVGLVAGQIAKILDCRVIGIAGSDKKLEILRNDFGFDEVINYKTNSHLKNTIARLCPNGVDIYFDNVGGEISDAVINNINIHGRVALCGQISLYNCAEIPVGPRLQSKLISRSVLMQGFIVGNYQSHFTAGIQQLTQWLKEGKLIYKETIFHGFDQLPAAFLGLFNGDNTGKMIVEI